MLRVARFLRCYLTDREGRSPESEEVRLRVGDDFVEGTLYRGPDDAPAPGWIVLHGITVRGRKHASLVRFARALAGSGATVLVPDVPAWRALRIDADAARVTLIAGAAHLRDRVGAFPGGVGAVGFSFGATHALVAAADPELREVLRTVIGFGGYCDLRRATECMMTGEHEWAGERHSLRPDPYGRWVVAANYLPWVPGCEGMTEVARGALRLAEEAGARGSYAGAADYDPLKAEIRAELGSAKERRVWDLLAPLADGLPTDLPAARQMGLALADAALSRDPRLDPRPVLGEVRARVVLAHGHGDRLIPFTETLRLHSYLAGARCSATITRLFAHSRGEDGLRGVRLAREGARFFGLLRRALG